jgi:hypothetical protein
MVQNSKNQLIGCQKLTDSSINWSISSTNHQTDAVEHRLIGKTFKAPYFAYAIYMQLANKLCWSIANYPCSTGVWNTLGLFSRVYNAPPRMTPPHFQAQNWKVYKMNM